MPILQGTDVSWAYLPWPWQAGWSERRGMAQRWCFALPVADPRKKQARQGQQLFGQPTVSPGDPPLWMALLPLSRYFVSPDLSVFRQWPVAVLGP